MKTTIKNVIVAGMLIASLPIRAQTSAKPRSGAAGDGRPLKAPVSKISPARVKMARRPASQTGHASSKTRAAPAEIGPQVLAFCSENLGKKVGDGECHALAAQALAKALAKAGAPPRETDAPNKGDYVWGTQVALIEGARGGQKGLEGLARVKPGDLIQFRDARFEGRRRDGKAGRYWAQAGHHTAVVEEVDAAQGILKVIEQNSSGMRKVIRSTVHLADLVKGWLRTYRPLARSR